MQDIATLIGTSCGRRASRPFGILQADRRQHVFIIGQTGTGKSSLLPSLAKWQGFQEWMLAARTSLQLFKSWKSSPHL